MTHRIRSVLRRTHAQVLTRRVPTTGRHRRSLAEAAHAIPRTASGLRLLVRTGVPPWLPAKGFAPVVDGPSPLVRPYYLAHELHAERAAFALGVAA